MLSPSTKLHISAETRNAATTITNSRLVPALHELDAWIEAQQFEGWDPHDALNSPVLRFLAGNGRLRRIALVQALRRCPLNLRPVLRVPKGRNPKAFGLFLSTYAMKFRFAKHPAHLQLVRFFARWLCDQSSRGFAGPCWGYNFDWPNRAFFAPAGTPTIVNTVFVALALLQAESLLQTPNEQPTSQDLDVRSASIDGLHIARGSCEFILRDLNVHSPQREELCFSYTPGDRRFVHNANVLGAWLLAAVYARTGEPELADTALRAARFTCARQRKDGSWPYGLNSDDQWVDNFHTGYLLTALAQIGLLIGTAEFASSVERGYGFWKTRMFTPEGLPKYLPHRTFPIDVHCVAQSILTYLEFSTVDGEAMSKAEQIADWAMRNLQDKDGFFHYQIHRRHRVRIPYMRWGQAWMQLALTKLLVETSHGHSPTEMSTLRVQHAL